MLTGRVEACESFCSGGASTEHDEEDLAMKVARTFAAVLCIIATVFIPAYAQSQEATTMVTGEKGDGYSDAEEK